MWTKTEDVYVMKLVDFIARIPEHLDLHFYDFSMNFYAFSKFTGLNLRVHVVFAFRPLEVFKSQIGPSPVFSEQGQRAWPDSGEDAHRRRGEGGGKR